MKGKTKYWIKKTKYLWLFFFIWLLIALGVVFGINYLTNTPYGKFEKAPIAQAYHTSLRHLDYLTINIKGLDLELGMSDSRRDIGIYLLGDDDSRGKIDYKLEDRGLVIYGQTLGRHGTLRVILPQDDLVAVNLEAEQADIEVRDFRADSLSVLTNGYDVCLLDVKADRLEVNGKQTNIRLKDNILGSTYLESPFGNFDARDNDITLLEASFGGSALLYDRLWQGQWRVKAGRGIYALSRWIPYNTLLEARSYGKGNVKVLYKGKWEEARVSEQTQKSYFALRGKANNNLLLFSDEGDIIVEKRGRYTKALPVFDNE